MRDPDRAWRRADVAERVALWVDGAAAPVRFGDLADRVDDWSSRLRSAALLAIEMEPAADVVAAFLAARTRGVPVIPVARGSFDPARGLLPVWTPDAYVRRAGAGPLVLELHAAAPPLVAPDGLALLLDADGTGGSDARRACLGADAVAHAQAALAGAWADGDTDRLLLAGPLLAYLPLMALESALWRGVGLVLSARSVADSGLWDVARRSQATTALLTGAQLALAARDDYRGFDQAGLRSVVVLGGTTAPALRDAAALLPAARPWSLRAVDGSAETGVLSIREIGEAGHWAEGSAPGRAAPAATRLAPVRRPGADGPDGPNPSQPGVVVADGSGAMMGLARERRGLAALATPTGWRSGIVAAPDGSGSGSGPNADTDHDADVADRRVRLDEVERRLEEAGHPCLAVASDGRLVLFDLTGDGTPDLGPAAAARLGLDPAVIDVAPGDDLPIDAQGEIDAEALQARADLVTAVRRIPSAVVQALAQATGTAHPAASDSLRALGADPAGQALWARRVGAVVGDLPDDWARRPLAALVPRGPGARSDGPLLTSDRASPTAADRARTAGVRFILRDHLGLWWRLGCALPARLDFDSGSPQSRTRDAGPGRRGAMTDGFQTLAAPSPDELSAAGQFWRLDRIDPERPALLDAAGGRVVSYGDLCAQADAIAGQMGAATLAALEFDSRPDSIAAYLACWRAGVAVIVAEPGQLDLGSRLRGTWLPDIVLRRETPGGELRLERSAPVEPAPHPDLRLLLSTSGTTGAPKLVRLSGAAVAANAAQIVRSLDLRAEDRAMLALPLFYSYGLSVLHSHLALGAAVILTDRSVSDTGFWDQTAAQGATTLALVPHQIELIARDKFGGPGRTALRMVTQAGGRMGPDIGRAAWEAGRQQGWDLHVMYGQTEASPRMATVPPELLPDALDCIGRALPGGAFEIRDESGAPIRRPGTSGELVYRGPNVMMGYATTRDELAGEPDTTELHTGDLAEWTPSGLVRITGRRSRMVKLYGKRIGLDDIEARLETIGFYAFAAGVGDRLVLLVRGREDLDEVRVATASLLGVPAGAVLAVPLARLPLLPSGKTDRQALQTAAETAAGGGDALPASDLTAALRAATRSRTIAPQDSFASLGGDSLGRLDWMLSVERALGVLPDDWETATLANLSRRRPERRAEGGHAAAGPVRATVPVEVLLRIAAMVFVILGHATPWPLGGGTWVFLILMGASIARGLRQTIVQGGVTRILRLQLWPIVPLYFALLLGWSVLRGAPPAAFLTFGANLTPVAQGLPIEPYWYISLFVQISLILALAAAIPPVRRAVGRDPWALAAGLTFTCGVLALLADAAGPMWLAGGAMARGLPAGLWMVGLGLCLALAAEPGRARATVGLCALSLVGFLWLGLRHGLTPTHLLSPACALALTMLAIGRRWQVRLPRRAASAAMLAAQASLYVYLFHVPVLGVLADHIARPAPLALAVVAATFAAALVFAQIAASATRRPA